MNFTGADFRGTDFRGADFCSADFFMADFTESNFCKSRFDGVNFTYADMSESVGIRWAECGWYENGDRGRRLLAIDLPGGFNISADSLQ